MYSQDITSIIIVALVLILIFLALREVNTWYWKINELLKNVREINAKLTKLLPEEEKPKFSGSNKDDAQRAAELEAQHKREHPKKDWSNLKPN